MNLVKDQLRNCLGFGGPDGLGPLAATPQIIASNWLGHKAEDA
jgi:hypothetical protein